MQLTIYYNELKTSHIYYSKTGTAAKIMEIVIPIIKAEVRRLVSQKAGGVGSMSDAFFEKSVIMNLKHSWVNLTQ